jgi:hypothetical protein
VINDETHATTPKRVRRVASYPRRKSKGRRARPCSPGIRPART